MKKTYRYLAIAGLALASPVHAQPADPAPSPLTVQPSGPRVPVINPPATAQAPNQAPGGQSPGNQINFGVSPALMPNIVVTATGYPEKVSQIASTIQVISWVEA